MPAIFQPRIAKNFNKAPSVSVIVICSDGTLIKVLIVDWHRMSLYCTRLSLLLPFQNGFFSYRICQSKLKRLILLKKKKVRQQFQILSGQRSSISSILCRTYLIPTHNEVFYIYVLWFNSVLINFYFLFKLGLKFLMNWLRNWRIQMTILDIFLFM